MASVRRHFGRIALSRRGKSVGSFVFRTDISVAARFAHVSGVRLFRRGGLVVFSRLRLAIARSLMFDGAAGASRIASSIRG